MAFSFSYLELDAISVIPLDRDALIVVREAAAIVRTAEPSLTEVIAAMIPEIGGDGICLTVIGETVRDMVRAGKALRLIADRCHAAWLEIGRTGSGADQALALAARRAARAANIGCTIVGILAADQMEASHAKGRP